jgi:cation transport ATPase
MTTNNIKAEETQNKTPEKPGSNTMAIWIIVGLVLFLFGLVAFYFFGSEHLKAAPIYLYLLIAIGAAVFIIGVIFAILVAKGKIKKQEPDYRALFIVGLIWIPLCAVFNNPAFWVISLTFIVLGLANKDKWKDRPKWSEMSQAEKNFKLAVLIILGLALLLGLVAFLVAYR